MKQERVSIVIDGSNFYHRLRELQLSNLLKLNYGAFSDFLSRTRTCVERKYYIAPIREESGNLKSRELMINQQKLMSALQRQGWQLGLGHLLKTDTYHEKGVDVLRQPIC